MSQEAILYTVNLIIGAILAGVMSQYWELTAGGMTLRFWIVAAWTLAAADLLFLMRSGVSNPLVRALPTVMVTAGHAVLLLAAQQVRRMHPTSAAEGTPATPPSYHPVLVVVALHIAALVAYVSFPELTGWRSVTNGMVWGGLSLAAAVTLWRSSEPVRRVMFLPALVLALQGVFHAARILLATRAVVEPGSGGAGLVQLLGDIEVSLFMVSLFVSVLVALLRQSNTELQAALANVRQLSSMLPVCAWCSRVRDDDGYWQKIEQYLHTHRVSVTHGLCESCESKHFAGGTPPVVPAQQPVGSGI
ncbi:MAG: hypothetical protein V4617_21140 [Gemmatimonadota bacterium]